MAYGYFKSTGEVVAISMLPLDYSDDGFIEVEVADHLSANTVYLDTATMTAKERRPFELLTSYNLVVGVPIGTTVTILEGQFIAEDDRLEFDADVSEVRTVFLDHPHYISQYLEVPTGPEAA